MTQHFSEQEDDMTEYEAGNPVYAFTAAGEVIPGREGTVFAATAAGLLHSSDGGQTWASALSALSLAEPLPVTSLAVIRDPLAAENAAHQAVVAGSVGGLFHSVDGGQSWQMVVFPSPPPTISALACSPNVYEDDWVFAGTMEDGVFSSQDGGRRWTAWNFGLLDLNVMSLVVSPDFSQDETLFVGAESGIFRSTNGGRAWREVELPFGYDAILCLAYSPRFAQDQRVYAGTENHGLWVSADAGKTWQPSGSFDEPINVILVDDAAATLLAVTSLKIWRSSDAGETWNVCWTNEAAEEEITAVLAPQGIGAGAPVLVGFVGGSIEALTLG